MTSRESEPSSYPAGPGAGQVHSHDVWRIEIVAVHVVHGGRDSVAVGSQHAAGAGGGRPVPEVPGEPEIVDLGRRLEGRPEAGYLSHPNGHVVTGVDVYRVCGEFQANLDQGVGGGLLQEVQPALHRLDLRLYVGDLILDFQRLLHVHGLFQERQEPFFRGPQAGQPGLAVYVLVGNVFTGDGRGSRPSRPAPPTF